MTGRGACSGKLEGTNFSAAYEALSEGSASTRSCHPYACSVGTVRGGHNFPSTNVFENRASGAVTDIFSARNRERRSKHSTLVPADTIERTHLASFD